MLPGILSFITAYWAGVLTFFASCLAPLTPTYIAYLGGILGEKALSDAVRQRQRTIIMHTLLFVCGFLVIFMIFGLTATSVGNFFGVHRPWLQRIGGLYLLAMGAFLLGLWQPQVLLQEWRLQKPILQPRISAWGSFLFGITFGLAWSPCIGPVLATILFWAASNSHAGYGISLLFFFGIGMGTPFLLLALFFDQFVSRLHAYQKVAHILLKLSGLLILFFGLMLLLGKSNLLMIQFVEPFMIDSLSF